jgi:riboflavin synthase
MRMFTGIVEAQGVVSRVGKGRAIYKAEVSAGRFARGIKPGESIAVDGVCLTVTGRRGGVVTFDIIQETLSATTLGLLKPGRRVNLERALKADGRLGGHFVTGHVDAVGGITHKLVSCGYCEYRIAVPAPLMAFIVQKGSVAVDGISLTVVSAGRRAFAAAIIPYTLQITSLGSKAVGDSVNVETDILAKYVRARDI